MSLSTITSRFAERHHLTAEAVEIAAERAWNMTRHQFLRQYGQTKEALEFHDQENSLASRIRREHAQAKPKPLPVEIATERSERPSPIEVPMKRPESPTQPAGFVKLPEPPAETPMQEVTLESPDVAKATMVIRVPVWVCQWYAAEAERAGTTVNKLMAAAVYTHANRSRRAG